MIRKCKIDRTLLALAAALATTPLAAQEPMSVTGARQPVYQERVNFVDLDLNKGSAQSALRLRVKSASSRVCQQAEGSFHDEPSYNGGLSCDDQTYSDAKPQIRAAIDRAKTGKQLAALTMIITAPRSR